MQSIFKFMVLSSLLWSASAITLSFEETKDLRELFEPPLDNFGMCPPNEYVNLLGLGIKKIPRDLVNSNGILSIDLSRNEIEEVSSSAFKNARTLTCLDLSRNNIPVEMLITFGHESLAVLDLSYQREQPSNSEWDELVENKTLITTMSTYFPKLRYVDLSGNKFNFLPQNFSEVMPRLEHLYLKNRNLRDVSDDFFPRLPKALQSLHFENNIIDIIDFPEEVSIVALYLDGNPLSVRAKHRLTTSSLKILSLANCSLDILPDSLPGNLPNLISLDLSENALSKNFDILRLLTYRNLQKLFLSHNELEVFIDVTSQFSINFQMIPYNEFTKLDSLSLSYNKISNIPGVIHGFPALRALNLRANQIRNIGVDTFSLMTNLEKLDLSNNQLQSLPAKWLHPLYNLRHLDLRHNKFSNIPDMFGRLPLLYKTNLTDLYVKSTALQALDTSTLNYLPASCVLHVC